jgi:4-amino-4-deoxy-L-arabinose transferase-like glycosyltransferase
MQRGGHSITKAAMTLAIVIWCLIPLSYRLFQPFLTRADNDAAAFAQSARNYLRYGLLSTRFGMTLNTGDDPATYFYNDHHPPGISLATALVYKVLGVSDWGSRIYPGICTLGSALVLFLLWRRHRGAGPALLVVAVLATLPGYGHFGAKLGEEAPTFFWGLLTILLYQRWKFGVQARNRPSLGPCLAAYALGCASGWAAFYVGPLLMIDASITLGIDRARRRTAVVSLGLTALVCLVLAVGHIVWLTGSPQNILEAAKWKMFTKPGTNPSGAALQSWLSKEAGFFLRLFGMQSVILGAAGAVAAAMALLRKRGNRDVVVAVLVLVGVGLAHPLAFRRAAFVHDWLLFHLLAIVSIAVAEGILLLASVARGAVRAVSSSPWPARGASAVVVAGTLGQLAFAGAQGLHSLSDDNRCYSWTLLGNMIAEMAPGESSVMSNLLTYSYPTAFYVDRTIIQVSSVSQLLRQSSHSESTIYLREMNSPIPPDLDEFLSGRRSVDLATMRIYNLADPGSGTKDPDEQVAFRGPEAWRGTLAAEFGGVVRLTSYRVDGPLSELAPVSKAGLFLGLRAGTLSRDRIVRVATFWSTEANELPDWRVYLTMKSRSGADPEVSLPIIALDEAKRPMLSSRSGQKQFQIHGAFMVEADSPPGEYDLYVAVYDGTQAVTPVLPGPPRSRIGYVPIGPLPIPGRDISAGS